MSDSTAPTPGSESVAAAEGSEGGDSTLERIVAAAKEEFARYGIAGARVNRIAQQARTSKERVYAYFRSKEELYGHVTAHELAGLAEATPMDPTDLPGYAGRLFDHFTVHPDNHRLLAWGRLELGEPSADRANPVRATIGRKVELLRAAQQAGQLDGAWDPVDVLALVNQLAATWAAQQEIGAAAAGQAADPSLAARRAAVVKAVERLFPRVE